MRRIVALLAFGMAAAGLAAAQTVDFSCGTPRDGSFALGIDTYNLVSQPGDIILIRLLSTGAPFSPRIVVKDQRGLSLNPGQLTDPRAVIGTGASLAQTYNLVAGGFYQIQVQNFNATPDASYKLVFSFLNRPCAGAALSCGTALQDSIAAAFQINSYPFAANANDVVSVRWTRLNAGDFVPLVAVYSSAGNLLLLKNGQGAVASAAAGRMDVPVPADGPLVVVVMDSKSATGKFAISLTTLNRPCGGGGGLNCGAVTQSTIAAPLNVQTYPVVMTAGDVGVFRTAASAAGNSIAPYVEMYDSQGSPVALNATVVPSSHAVANFAFNVRTSGTYTLLIRDASQTGTGTGDFLVTMMRFNRPCSVQGTVSCGSAIDGSIGGVLGANVYRLTAAANDVYLFRLLRTGANPLFHPRVEFYDPVGNLAGTVTTSDLTRQTLTLPSAGDYTLVVSDGADATQAGSYRLSSIRLNRPCNAGTLSCGAVSPGTFSQALDAGVYTYTAAAGESFSVRMFDPAGALQPDLEIYDSAGTQVGQSISANYTGVDVVRPAGGAYTILAMDSTRRPVGGPFTLDLLRTVNACAVSAAQAQTVAGVVTASLPFVSYSVPASAGDSLLVRSASTTPGFAAQMELYDPSGSRLDTQTYALSRKAAAAGTYTVIVGASAPRTGGGYALSWQLLNKPAGAVPLACGGSAGALLSGTNQFQYYAAAASSGDVLRLLLTKLSDNFSPQADVYDPAGGRIASSLDVTQPAKLDGTYLVVVGPSSSNAESGTYSLAFQRPNNPCSPASLICGQTALRKVTVPAQLDTYTFSGTGGDRADIKLSQRSGGYTPFAELYDASGNRLTASSSGTLLANLAATATYTVLVRDTRGTTLGSYRIGVQDDTNACTVNDTEAPSVTLLAPTGGEVVGGGTSYLIQWQSDDNVGVAGHTLALSTDGGQTFPATIAAVGGNTQSYLWQVPPDIAPSRTAVVKVTATDAAGNAGSAASGPLMLIGGGFTPNNTATYGYDSLNRMIQATLGDGRTITYTYDAAGNLLGITISQ